MKIAEVSIYNDPCGPTPQWIIESIIRRKKKKAKNRRLRKIAKTTQTTKNNRRHKLRGYQGTRKPNSSKSWRK